MEYTLFQDFGRKIPPPAQPTGHPGRVQSGRTPEFGYGPLIDKRRLEHPTAGRPTVPSGSGQLSLFRTIETSRDRTEPAVNRRLGFEVVPKQFSVSIF